MLGNGIDTHSLRYLRGMELKARFQPVLESPSVPPLLKIDLAIDPPPALSQHSIGGKFRAGDQGGTDAAAIARKGESG